MATMTAQQKLEREKIVRELIDEGLSINEIAERVGVRQQSMQKFLKARGWKTRNMLERDEAMTVQNSPEKQARREKRKAMKETVDRSGAVSDKGDP